MTPKITTEIFIQRAREKHGDKYDYSKVEYINTQTKVCIICKEHGEFWQRPNDHLKGQGCKECGRKKTIKASIKWTQEKCFIEAQKYTSRSEFALQAASAYVAANNNNWLSQYTWFEEKHKPNGFWTYENCYIEAQKYTTRHDFERRSGSAYNVAMHNGWINDYTWLKLLRAKPWTYDTCYNEAKKYSTVTEFRRNNLDAFVRARKNGWLKDYNWIKRTIHEKWTYEECYAAATQYVTKKQFQENDRLAYKAAVKNKWMDNFTWLTDDRVLLFTDKIDCVYVYLFPETKTIYVGRTIRPKDRDKEHVYNTSQKDVVALYAAKMHIPVPSMQIIEDNLSIKEGLEREDFWIKFYKAQGYSILNKAKTGIGTGSLGAIGAGKWTRRTCFKEAKKYQTRSEFRHNSGSAYAVALNNGWLDDYTWMPKPLTRLEDRWTFEECANESRKYQSRTEFLQGNYSAYRLALRNNWLRFFVWLKKPIKRKWNYDSCLSIAQKATSLSEFQRQYAGAYNAARKYGWLKDYTWFKPLHKSNGYWNYEECFKEAKKYKSKIEFRKNCSTAYSRALKHNWIKDYTWFLDTKYLQKKPRRWTEEACKQEAEKYTTKKEFLKNNASAYSVAIQNGWLKNYTWLKAGKKPNGYWNLDRCKAEAAKYANRSKFCKGCPAAFDSSIRHQWLDEFFPK